MDDTEILEPPVNPSGGKTLIVDGRRPGFFERPSRALLEAGPHDQVFIRPGVYEDRVFVSDRPIRLIGAGKNHVQIFSRRGGPFYLQKVPEGLISGVTFRYVGSDPHSAMNVLDTNCTIRGCRVMEGVLSGIVIYGPETRLSFIENEVCYNRESGIFIFAGARPYVSKNISHNNHHFGIAVRDFETYPDIVRNTCRNNMLSGILLFHLSGALLLENHCSDNLGWGVVVTPDCKTSPAVPELPSSNRLEDNPKGSVHVTRTPLSEIGR